MQEVFWGKFWRKGERLEYPADCFWLRVVQDGGVETAQRLFLLLAGLVASGTFLHAEAQDSFLDQPLPARFLPPLQSPEPGIQPCRVLDTSSYGNLARLIRAASPKPVIFPAGWLKFVEDKEQAMDGNKGKAFFLHGRMILGCLQERVSMRDYLTVAFGEAGLSWKYDAPRDVIMADFPWRTDDSRSSDKLLQVLFTTRPAPVQPHGDSDAWKSAFDALLSKPENFPRVWQLRYSADDRYWLSLTNRIENMVAKTIRDASGGEHIVFVNDQPELCNPGPPGSISYYLFDTRGKFESGGISTIGYRCFNDSAWLDPDGRHLDVRVYNNGSERRDSIFALEKGGLIRQSFLIEGSPAMGGVLDGLDRGGDLYFHVAAVHDGHSLKAV